MVSTTCDLCGCASHGGSRNFGLEFCEVCETGQLSGRLDSWGGSCQSKEFIRNDDPEPWIRVVSSVTGAQPLMARFERRTAKHTLKRLFSAKLTAGDPLFDKSVIITGSRTNAVLEALVRDDGFQSAILSLTAHCETVNVNSSTLKVEAQLTDFDLRAEIPLATVAVLRHLARLG